MPSNVSVILASQGRVILLIAAAAFVLNLPLGYLREGTRKFSPAWFVYVHLSVPLIALLRITNHLSYWLIPLFIACAVGGQLAGGSLRRTRAGG
jgi:hypothetical protein